MPSQVHRPRPNQVGADALGSAGRAGHAPMSVPASTEDRGRPTTSVCKQPAMAIKAGIRPISPANAAQRAELGGRALPDRDPLISLRAWAEIMDPP